jgi:hypothetical protein
MSAKTARKTRRTKPLTAVAVHCLVRDLHSEAVKNGITITPTETLDDKCPDCGGDIYDMFHVEEWGRTYCEECLDRELLKFLPNEL